MIFIKEKMIDHFYRVKIILNYGGKIDNFLLFFSPPVFLFFSYCSFPCISIFLLVCFSLSFFSFFSSLSFLLSHFFSLVSSLISVFLFFVSKVFLSSFFSQVSSLKFFLSRKEHAQNSQNVFGP